MASSTLPVKPVENWEQVRDEWIAAVDALLRDAEAWSRKQDWAVRRDPKTITEDRLGQYTVPRLLIHGVEGRLLLDPVARFVVGATGLIDFCVLPSYDAVAIVRTETGWQMHPPGVDDPPRPWSEQAFVEMARELLRAA